MKAQIDIETQDAEVKAAPAGRRKMALHIYISIYDVQVEQLLFSVCLSNRLLAAGLEPVLSHIEQSSITYNRHFSTNIKIKFIKLIPVLFT